MESAERNFCALCRQGTGGRAVTRKTLHLLDVRTAPTRTSPLALPASRQSAPRLVRGRSAAPQPSDVCRSAPQPSNVCQSDPQPSNVCRSAPPPSNVCGVGTSDPHLQTGRRGPAVVAGLSGSSHPLIFGFVGRARRRYGQAPRGTRTRMGPGRLSSATSCWQPGPLQGGAC